MLIRVTHLRFVIVFGGGVGEMQVFGEKKRESERVRARARARARKRERERACVCVCVCVRA